MSEPCPLCLRADRPMTREHIFARWLVREVQGARLYPSSARTPHAPERIGRVTAAVCADCNAGWMSVLEDAFRRALFGRPRLGSIQAPDRVTLSRWFTKTGVLLAHAGGMTLIDPGRRAQLVAGMPADIEVFLARRRRPPQRLDFRLDVPPDRGTDRARSVAILLDDVVAHVAEPEVLDGRHGTRLWPLRSHLLRWETLPVITLAQPDRQ